MFFITDISKFTLGKFNRGASEYFTKMIKGVGHYLPGGIPK